MRSSRTRVKRTQPAKVAPKRAHEDQEDTRWFNSPEWQAGEAEADEQTRTGQIKTYESVEDLLADLHREAAG